MNPTTVSSPSIDGLPPLVGWWEGVVERERGQLRLPSAGKDLTHHGRDIRDDFVGDHRRVEHVADEQITPTGHDPGQVIDQGVRVHTGCRLGGPVVGHQQADPTLRTRRGQADQVGLRGLIDPARVVQHHHQVVRVRAPRACPQLLERHGTGLCHAVPTSSRHLDQAGQHPPYISAVVYRPAHDLRETSRHPTEHAQDSRHSRIQAVHPDPERLRRGHGPDHGLLHHSQRCLAVFVRRGSGARCLGSSEPGRSRRRPSTTVGRDLDCLSRVDVVHGRADRADVIGLRRVLGFRDDAPTRGSQQWDYYGDPGHRRLAYPHIPGPARTRDQVTAGPSRVGRRQSGGARRQKPGTFGQARVDHVQGVVRPRTGQAVVRRGTAAAISIAG